MWQGNTQRLPHQTIVVSKLRGVYYVKSALSQLHLSKVIQLITPIHGKSAGETGSIAMAPVSVPPPAAPSHHLVCSAIT